MAGQSCAAMYTNQVADFPVCTADGRMAVIEFTKQPPVESLGDTIKAFAGNVWSDFKATNAATAGKAAKTGAGLLTAGKVADYYGARTAGNFLFNFWKPLPGEFFGSMRVLDLTAGQRIGRVAMAAGVNFVLVTLAFETGVLIGAIVNQFLPEDVKDAIGGTINEIVNEGGYKLLWERPFGFATGL